MSIKAAVSRHLHLQTTRVPWLGGQVNCSSRDLGALQLFGDSVSQSILTRLGVWNLLAKAKVTISLLVNKRLTVIRVEKFASSVMAILTLAAQARCTRRSASRR